MWTNLKLTYKNANFHVVKDFNLENNSEGTFSVILHKVLVNTNEHSILTNKKYRVSENNLYNTGLQQLYLTHVHTVAKKRQTEIHIWETYVWDNLRILNAYTVMGNDSHIWVMTLDFWTLLVRQQMYTLYCAHLLRTLSECIHSNLMVVSHLFSVMFLHSFRNSCWGCCDILEL